MVKITNGINEYEVSAGAFNSVFKKQGYHKVETKVEKENKANSGKKTDEEVFVEEIIEKPISEWTKDELKKFAMIKGINTSSAKTVTEVREIIKNAIG